MATKYQVSVGGSKLAQKRWPTKIYKHRSSAKRKIKQIKAAHDLGVATIGLIPIKEPIP